MKKYLLLIIAVITFFTSYGQGKQRMLVEYFTSSSSKDRAYIDLVRNQIISGTNKINRHILIDVDSESSLKIEENRRAKESAMGDKEMRLGAIKTLGANSIMTGNIDGFTLEKVTPKEGDPYYKTVLTVTVKFLKVEDGSLHASETITTYGGGSLTGKTKEAAYTSAINVIADKMDDIINIYFPIKGKIVELKEQKKNKLISCYADFGSDHGVSKGQYIKVFQIKHIAGRETKQEIGRMKIEAVVAGDLSECKVTKGGDKILKGFNDGQEFILETDKDRSFIGALGL